MEFLNSIPSWVGELGAAGTILAAVIVMAGVLGRILPFLLEVNKSREQVAAEQKSVYEKSASVFDALIRELKGAMGIQREAYEGKLEALEIERNIERDKLVDQIKQLTAQVQALTERITKLEAEGKTKDEEINRLKEQVATLTIERDTAVMKLDAFETAQLAMGANHDDQSHPSTELSTEEG